MKLLLFLLLVYSIRGDPPSESDCHTLGMVTTTECNAYCMAMNGGSGSSGDDDYIFKAKCHDDKTKTNACAFKNQLVSGTTIKEEFLIFKKCGKGEKCDYEGRGICRDDDRIKTRKNGKSCNYDDDCLCGKCSGNKCTVKKEGEICYSSSTRERYYCEAGLICHDYSDTSNDEKCVKPVLTAGTKPDRSTECGEGLELDAEGKCQKYGTIADGEKTQSITGINKLCKSGLSHQKADGSDYICDRIEEEPVCDATGVITKGKWAKGDEIGLGETCKHATDYNGNIVYYYEYTKLQSKLFEDFLEDYNDLDLEDLNTKDKYFNMDFKKMLKWKTYKKYLLFKNAPALEKAGLIDSDGEVKSDKKCEYEFIMKNVLSSSNTKVGLLLLVLFALLL